MEVHASLKAEEIAYLGPIPITNSMLMAWLALLVLGVFAYFAGRNPKLVPSGAQNVMETILEALLSLVESTAGHYARRIFPLVATLFLFILTANYMNLLPGVGTIWVANPNLHREQETHAAPALSLVRTAEAAPVAALRETSVVMATAAAAIFAHEHVPPRRLAGAVVVVAGIAFIAVA
jgi:F0F1-type ATP synthase membrane subunit a